MKKVSLRGKTITIVGPSTYETFLKAHYLTQETGVTFRFFRGEKSGPPPGNDPVSSSVIVLVDCQMEKVENCLPTIKADSQLNGIFLKPLVLFNVAPEDVQKGEAVNGVIKGLLSPYASPEVFLEMIIHVACEERRSATAECGALKQT
ncbi:MAG TPA: hypothetical protein P5551_02480 [Syntrophales bacterium]|jgi:hypothetical protein|nr:hypothetical protein [Syntrophales bacterium]